MIINHSCPACISWRRTNNKKSNYASKSTISGCTSFRVNKLRRRSVWIWSRCFLAQMVSTRNISRRWSKELPGLNFLAIFIPTKNKFRASTFNSFSHGSTMLSNKLTQLQLKLITPCHLQRCGKIFGSRLEASLYFKRTL